MRGALSAPSEDPKAGLAALAREVLAYVSSPWRAVWLTLVAILVAIGFLIWEERAILRDYVAKKPPPTSVKFADNLDQVIAGLFYSTTVDGIMVWSINLGNATGEFILGRRRDLSSWVLTTKVLRVFTENSDPLITARVLRGEAACAEPVTYQFPLALALARDGIHEACFIPIPPSRTAALIGLVILGWKEKPPESTTEAGVAAVLREESRIVATDGG